MDVLQKIIAKKLPKLPLFYQEQPEIIPKSEDGRKVSEAEYWEHYYVYAGDSDFNYEWNNGYLEEKPVSDYKGWQMYEWFNGLLRHYLTANPIGATIGFEFAFRMALPHKISIRKPDLGIVLNDNPVALHLNDPSYAGIFDLCIEILSHSSKKDTQRDTVEKKEEYELAGVREYYIIDSKNRETVFYRRNQYGKYMPIRAKKGGIIESQALPGFRFRKSDLQRQPSMKEMADDDLYQDFVLPFYQDEKQRAEQAEKLYRDEKQRAEQLEKQLNRLTAKLKKQGMSIE